MFYYTFIYEVATNKFIGEVKRQGGESPVFMFETSTMVDLLNDKWMETIYDDQGLTDYLQNEAIIGHMDYVEFQNGEEI